MYKLLIVDDEVQTRCGLRDLVDWAALGIDVIGDAEDGDIALPMLLAQSPDILLTDVRMNRMDGHALAREARKRLPGVEIVFISGYAEADYLREALRVEAYDYLYKPIRMSELRALMERLVSRLDERAEKKRQIEKSRLLLEKSRPLLVERFMRSWIGGMLEDEAVVRERLEQLDLSIPREGGLVAAAFQPVWPTFPTGGQAEAYLMLLEEGVREQLPQALVCVQETGLIALLPASCPGEVEALHAPFQTVTDQMRGVTDATLRIGLSAWHAAWIDVPKAVREAQKTIERGIFWDEQAVLAYDAQEPAWPSSAVPLDTAHLERHLSAGDFGLLWEGIASALTALEKDAGGTELARKLLMSCALRADLLLARLGLMGIDALPFLKEALLHPAIAPARGALEAALRDACERVRDMQGGKYSAVILQVMEIIRTRYAQRLSIDDLAEEAHYSAAHLSTLFRQETGMTIGDALFRARLGAAMELLETTRLPVSAVAEQSGYTDVQYFSRVFKRSVGITPLEYRKRALPC